MKLTMKKTPLLLALMAATTSWSSNLLAHGDSHQGLEEEWYMNVESEEDLEAQDAEDQHHAHGDMPMTAPAMNHSGMDHSQMNHEGMNHGEMNHDMSGMQGGSAPANARDPHAYSGGYTLTSGPYAMEGSRQLVLADEHWFSSLSLEQLGISRSGDETSKVAEGEYWIGTTWDRLALSFDIDHLNGETEAELGGYWRHAITAFWNTQLGVKHERGEGDSRNWIGLGFQGLAPYWFESEAMLYVGSRA